MSVACLLGTVPLAIIGERGVTSVDLGQWQIAAFAPGFLVSGWWLTQRRPRLAIGWIFIAAGVTVAMAGLAGAYAAASLVRGWPGTSTALWAFSWMWQPQSTLLAIAFVMFPDGTARQRWHRGVVWLLAALCGASMLVSMIRPGVIVATPDHLDGAFPGVVNPVGVEALRPFTDAVANPLLAASLVVFLVPMVVTGIGWWQSSGLRRRQFRWATLLQIAGVVVTAITIGLPGNLGPALILLQTLATQLLIVVAILQWRAFDVDVVIRRSLLAGSLLVFVLGVYGLAVVIVSAAVGRDGRLPSLIGAAVVVVTFPPAAFAVRSFVNRSFYGRRGDPYGVVAELGRRASAASEPKAALQEIVAAITDELKLPHAAIVDDQQRLLASSGGIEAGDDPVDFELEHQGVVVGTLRVGHRRGEDEMNPADQRLLLTLAHQVGASVRSYQLLDGLQAAREQLVVAREDERRRIQRDLHDGLGPQLTAVTMHLDAARNHLAAGNTDDTDGLLRDARRELHQAGGDVRRLVYSLGDPSIASLGLAPAVEAQVRLITQASGVAAVIDLRPLPPLSAATEEAIHRVIAEAVTNVVRHACAATCHVTLWSEGGNVLATVVDDGVGVGPGAHPGVGTRSFRDRADELGGTVTIQAGVGCGTVVRLELPIAPA